MVQDHGEAGPRPGEVTELLGRANSGDAPAFDALLGLLYGELRGMARGRLRGEREGHTLGPTALVHEAYLRLARHDRLGAENRAEFLAAASNTMRRVLIDHARARKRDKRGGEQEPLPLSEAGLVMNQREAGEVLALNDALDRLSRLDDRARTIVEYRYFGGLTVEETAGVLGVSTKTVQRSWTSAQAWLRKEIRQDLGL